MRPDEFANDPRIKDIELATVCFVLREITRDGPESILRFLDLWAKHFPKIRLAVTELYRQDDNAIKSLMTRSIPEHLLHHDMSKQNPLYRKEWLSIIERSHFEIVESLQRLPPIPPWPAGTSMSGETLVIEARG